MGRSKRIVRNISFKILPPAKQITNIHPKNKSMFVIITIPSEQIQQLARRLTLITIKLVNVRSFARG